MVIKQYLQGKQHRHSKTDNASSLFLQTLFSWVLLVLQAAYNNLERALIAQEASPVSIRSTAGLLGAAPAPGPSPRGPGVPRGGAGFVPVRPARRGTLHDENIGVPTTLNRVLLKTHTHTHV